MEASAVLEPEVLSALRAELPEVAIRTVAAVVAEVDEYADPLRGALGRTIAESVELALGTFLRLVGPPGATDPDDTLRAALDAAYALGRGEARSGRTVDALLAAYRVGARVAWAQWGTAAVRAGLGPERVVEFAERVFAYIDRLSASSVAGHGDELAVSGRVREQLLERLGRALVLGEPPEVLADRAARAGWEPPSELAAVLVPSPHARRVVAALDARALPVAADVLDDGRLAEDLSVLVVPPAGTGRPVVMRGTDRYVLGPTVAWDRVSGSYERALRALSLRGLAAGGVRADDVLGDLVLAADPLAAAELRARVLAPLADLPPETVERLAETLLAWLLHQGRREEVARALHVHPQTVRYRMTQVRQRYADLDDPSVVRDLVVGLSAPRG